METKNCIETRRSIRRFTGQAVSHEIIEALVREASFAPSWKNTQTARWTAVENRELLDRLGSQAVLGYAGNKAILDSCPVLMVLSTVTGRSGFERDGSYSTDKGDRWEMFDAGIAAQTFCLAAHDTGLGTVVMGIFDPKAVVVIVGVPEDQTVSALIALGYPAQEPAMPRRKDISELLEYR
jgi:Nitroreductase